MAINISSHLLMITHEICISTFFYNINEEFDAFEIFKIELERQCEKQIKTI